MSRRVHPTVIWRAPPSQQDNYAVLTSTRIARSTEHGPSSSVPSGLPIEHDAPTRVARRSCSRLQQKIYRLFSAAAQGETSYVGIPSATNGNRSDISATAGWVRRAAGADIARFGETRPLGPLLPACFRRSLSCPGRVPKYTKTESLAERGGSAAPRRTFARSGEAGIVRAGGADPPFTSMQMYFRSSLQRYSSGGYGFAPRVSGSWAIRA